MLNLLRTSQRTLYLFAIVGLLACSPEDGARGPQGPEGLQGPPGSVDPSLSTLDKLLAGLGGRGALETLDRFVVVSQGTNFSPGEGFDPNDVEEEVVTSTFTSTLSWDLVAGNWRTDNIRNTVFVALPIPLINSEIVTGTVGAVVGSDSVFTIGIPDLPPAAMLSSRVSARSKLFGLLNPHGALKDVLNDPSVVAEVGFGLLNGTPHEILEMQSPIANVQIWVNPGTGQVAKVSTYENDHFLRNRLLEVLYLDWRDVDGVAFPMDVILTLGGEILHEEHRLSVTVNPTFTEDLFTLPETMPAPTYDADLAAWGAATSQYINQFIGLGIALDARQLDVAPMELQDGVWHILGSSHHSMVVEQENGVVVVEPPLYPERSAAVIEWITTQFPTKPISHIVVTHHHEDHAGGLREYVAAGAAVVAAENGKNLYLESLTAESTIVPDGLSAQSVNPEFELVPLFGELVLDDTVNPVTVAYLANEHANDFVGIYLSNGGFYFQSDLYNPGNGGQAIDLPVAQQFLDGLSDSGFTVETLVGGHGATAPLSELEAFIANIGG